MKAIIDSNLWVIGGVILVGVLVAIVVLNLSQRARSTDRQDGKPSSRERNYREWKLAGMKSRKTIYSKDKNLCPCGSGLRYKDCCGR